METDKTGPELLEEAASEPTLDDVMRRDPRDVDDAALASLVEHQREARAQFKVDEDKKRAKKQGIVVEDED